MAQLVEMGSEVFSLFSQDSASLNMQKPTANFLQNAVLQPPGTDLVLLALPQSRSEVLLLCYRYASSSSSSNSSSPLVLAGSRSLALPQGSSLRCMCWLPNARSNHLAVAASDKVLLYSISVSHGSACSSTSMSPPELIMEVPSPANERIVQLLPLDNQDAHLHIVLRTLSNKAYYLHLHHEYGSFQAHTHHLFDHVHAMVCASSLQGIHVLDSHLHRCSYYSAAYIHTRLATATQAPHRTRESARLDVQTEQVLALAVADGHAIVSFAPVSSVALPTAAPSLSQSALTQPARTGSFPHVLAGTSLSEALRVPLRPDDEDAALMHASTASSNISALDRLLQVNAPQAPSLREEPVSRNRPVLIHEVSPSSSDPQSKPRSEKQETAAPRGGSAGAVRSYTYTVDEGRCEHGSSSLGAMSSTGILCDEGRDMLAVLEGQANGWVATASSTSAKVELCAVRSTTTVGAERTMRMALTLSPDAVCRGLAVLSHPAVSANSAAPNNCLLILQARKGSAAAAQPVALSTWRDFQYQLLVCPLQVAPARLTHEEPKPSSPPPLPPASVDGVLLQALQGLQSMLNDRFAHVDNLLASQQATIARLQAEVHTLRSAAAAAQPTADAPIETQEKPVRG